MATKAVQMGCGAPICRPMPKPAVCRSLFGRPTAEELTASTSEARRFLQLDIAEKSRKYEYDFTTGTPYSDSKRWEWQQVKIEDERKEIAKTPIVLGLTNNSAIQADRLQPPSVDESVLQCTVHCEDSTNVVVSVSSVIDVAALTPAEPTTAVADVKTSVSSSRIRKRNRERTMKDYFQVKKQRSSPSPVNVKDIDSSLSCSSCDSSLSQS